MRQFLLILTGFLVAGIASHCSTEEPPFQQVWNESLSRVTTETVVVHSPTGTVEQFQRPFIKDEFGRYVHFHGVNLSGSTKFPHTESFPDLGAKTSYVGKPFPLAEADKHFAQLQRLGFNSVRFLVNWEGLQPEGPDTFDEEYLDYIDNLVTRAASFGIYVLLDMHQDIFSRHLYVYYNSAPADDKGVPYERGSLESQVLSMVPPYDNWVRGDGAPRWVVEACLPEKELDSPAWGVPRLTYNLGISEMAALADVLTKFMGGADTGDTAWLDQLLAALPDPAELPEPYSIRQSNDFLPFTFWGLNGPLSVDSQRCFACLLAGNDVMPNYKIDGVGIQDYVQGAYAAAFAEVAKRTKDNRNIIGYDIMNEPMGFFLTYAATAIYFQTGLESSVETLLKNLLGEQTGASMMTALTGLKFLPGDGSDETKMDWGFLTDPVAHPDINYDIDMGAVVGLNLGFDKKYLQPFYERVGKAIQDQDENAIIWFEPSAGLNLIFEGESPQFNMNMSRPKGIKHAVYAPHWYPDIYPFPGFNQDPRDFQPEEWKYRDFGEKLQSIAAKASHSLGNIPVVLGEFGTYYNFNGIEASIEMDYALSAQILDAYYRGMEEMGGLSHMQWCFSPENSYGDGDGWNKEDFSVVGPDLEPRAWRAFVRPYARATSGKLLRTHFYSPHHPQDPDKGKPLPVGEYFLETAGKETSAPTEIFVPDMQYPDGFYVWVSDGYCYYDHSRQLLLWYPVDDHPDAVHELTLLPQRIGADVYDWDYFFNGDFVLNKTGGGK